MDDHEPVRQRCPWAEHRSILELEYHDREWGVPSHDDRHLFEMLVLEGAQAGLSWSTILSKRDGYRKAFAGFDPQAVARFDAATIERLRADPAIVRNRAKIESAVANARAALAVVEAFGSLDAYLWSFVDGQPLTNHWHSVADIPAATPQSHAMSRDLRQHGFRFVGPTICYAFMQATGMVNDHLADCFRHAEVGLAARS
ncbi:MAG TPA: DNA-3-methyladenine glycosylase I [Actinomycetota bacterium]